MIKPSPGGTPTTNMLRHLRKKHLSVYNEVQVNVSSVRQNRIFSYQIVLARVVVLEIVS